MKARHHRLHHAALLGVLLQACVSSPTRLSEAAHPTFAADRVLPGSGALAAGPRLAQRLANLGKDRELALVVGVLDLGPGPLLGYATNRDRNGWESTSALPGPNAPNWWLGGPAPLVDLVRQAPGAAALADADRATGRRWLWQERRISPSALPSSHDKALQRLPGGPAGNPRPYVLFALLLDESEVLLAKGFQEFSVVEGATYGLPDLMMESDAPAGQADLTARLDKVDAPVRPESPITLEGYLAGGGSVVDGSFQNARALDNLAYDDLTDGVALDDGFVLTDRADAALIQVTRDRSGTLTLTQLIGGNGAGTGLGEAGTAQLSNPQGIARDGSSGIFIVDRGNRRLVRWDLSKARLDLVAGGPGTAAVVGDGSANTATFADPRLVAVNDQWVVVEDGFILRAMDRSSGDIQSYVYMNTHIGAMAFGPDGKLWLTTPDDHTVQTWTPRSGLLTRVAGRSGEPGNGAGKPLDALLRRPTGLAVDAVGRVFISDSGNHVIKVIGRDGVLHRWVGPGTVVENALGIPFRIRGPRALVPAPADGGLLALDDDIDRAWFLKGMAP